MTLNQLRKIALALPETSEEPHFHKISFRCRGKIFATVEAGHDVLNVMLGDAAREPLLAIHADSLESLFWGNKVMGVRLQMAAADPALVRELLQLAWREKAPKSHRPD